MVEIHTGKLKLLNKLLPQFVIKPTQDQVASVDQVHLGPKVLQHAGKLQCNVACALYDNALRLAGKLKEVIGVNAELMTGDTGI
jgi:hypothetical protein